MSKNIIKKIMVSSFIFITMLILSTISNAVSLNISTSKSTVSPGETFTVTVTLDGAAGPVNASVSNGSGSFSNQWLENNSTSFNCIAGNSGTVTISASGKVGDFSTGDDINVSASKSVKIVQPSNTTTETNTSSETNTNTSSSNNSGSSGTNSNSSSSGSSSTSTSNSGSTSTTTTTQTKSSNANLSNLITSPVDFTGFKANKTEGYSITVENNVTEVKVTAKVQDSKASYKVTGNTNLKAGQTNVVKVTVTAEDGTQKVYKINVIRKNSEENNVPNVIETPEEKEITKKVNLTLKSLEIKGLTLNPKFSSNVYEYTADLTEDLTELEVLAIATQADDTIIEITGNKELKDGENIITIVVKTSDKKESKTYTVKVNKKVEEVIAEPFLSTQSNDNNQTGITLSKVDFSEYSKTQKIISLIIIACTICLVGIDIYILNEERKLSSRKQKYVGKRIKI